MLRSCAHKQEVHVVLISRWGFHPLIWKKKKESQVLGPLVDFSSSATLAINPPCPSTGIDWKEENGKRKMKSELIFNF